MKTSLSPGLRRSDASALSSFRLACPGESGGAESCVVAASPSFPRKRESSILIVAASILLLSAASSQAEEWISLEKSDGAALFAEKCGMCHRATGMGTGILARRMTPELALLENRADLQPEFVATAVRNGFGTMFPISRGEVSDPQLERIVAYLTRAKGEENPQ